MSEFRVASRYAKSLIELAQESQNLERINDDMTLLAKVCSENREFTLLLKSPIIKGDKKMAVLNAIFSGKVSDLTLAFFNIIIRKRREKFMPLMANEFHQQYNEIKGIQESFVTTTFSLTDDLRDEFMKLSHRITGKKTELMEIVDEHLVGGYILKIGDRQIDDSLKSKINELHMSLKDTTYEKKI